MNRIVTTKERAGYNAGVVLRNGHVYWIGPVQDTRSRARAQARRWIRTSELIHAELNRLL